MVVDCRLPKACQANAIVATLLRGFFAAGRVPVAAYEVDIICGTRENECIRVCVLVASTAFVFLLVLLLLLLLNRMFGNNSCNFAVAIG